LHSINLYYIFNILHFITHRAQTWPVADYCELVQLVRFGSGRWFSMGCFSFV